MVRVVMRQTRTAMLFVCAAALAACSDMSVAPKEHSGPSLLLGLGSDTTVTSFTVYPDQAGTYVVGGVHQLKVPAGAICDLATSSYGVTEWDEPCDLESQPVTIVAKSWTDVLGHPQVDFSPSLRFSPNVTVTLYMKDKKAAESAGLYQIDYCAVSSVCIDESLTDPSVATKDDLPNGFLYRRIKHFSGYNIAAGYAQ
jgi:hypothetical protein